MTRPATALATRGRGRRPDTRAGNRGGLLLIQWALERPPGALVELASAIEVSQQTLMRWVARTNTSRMPGGLQRQIATLAGVPVEAWAESV